VGTVPVEQVDEQADGLSYEQARDALAEAVRSLEAGGLTLEESLKVWERGERLAAICMEWLEGARARLAAAMAGREDADGASDRDPREGGAASGGAGRSEREGTASDQRRTRER
jgi:exodeoxyribonuclease VII small subunit